MKQAHAPATVGSYVEVVIDTADSHRKMAPCSKHRVGLTTLLRGVVIESPKWCADHVCLINSDTRAHNYIPPHRILSINNKVVVQPKKVEDRVLTVKASKGDSTYTVQLNGVTKKWSCTCPGFQFKKAECKHIQQVKNT
jgi:hypothetical protein